MSRGHTEGSGDVRPVQVRGRRGPGAPGAIAAAAVAMVALYALSTGSGTEPGVPTTTTFVGLDPFDAELQATSITSTPLSTDGTPDRDADAFGLDETDVAQIDAFVDWVGHFWSAVGGDGDPAIFVDVNAAEFGLGGLVDFLAAFHSQFVASECRIMGANGVECTVTARDPAITAITAIAITGPSERLVVGMGGSGLEYVETPPILTSTAITLSGHARRVHPVEFTAACDPQTIPDPPPPQRIGVLAATGECGDFLAGLVREYLIGESGSG